MLAQSMTKNNRAHMYADHFINLVPSLMVEPIDRDKFWGILMKGEAMRFDWF